MYNVKFYIQGLIAIKFIKILKTLYVMVGFCQKLSQDLSFDKRPRVLSVDGNSIATPQGVRSDMLDPDPHGATLTSLLVKRGLGLVGREDSSTR